MSQANVIPSEDFQAVVDQLVADSPRPWMDRVIFTLSHRAGLRACEIAGLRWRDVMTATGAIVPALDMWRIPDNIAKNGRGRKMVMHPDLFEALGTSFAALPAAARAANKPLILRNRVVDQGGKFVSEIDPAFVGVNPNTLQRYIGRRYAAAGMIGCSSHSGRRSFLTGLSRRVNSHQCSIHDVQLLAGHASLNTTARYIDLSENVGALVGSL